MRVLRHVADSVAQTAAAADAPDGDAVKREWAQHWIAMGLEALEAELQRIYAEDKLHTSPPRFSLGATVSLVDVVLVPQMYNARRFGVDVAKFPRLCHVTAELEKLDAFRMAAPESQADFK